MSQPHTTSAPALEANLMVGTALFSLRHLICRYPGSSKPTLAVQNVSIPRGKMVFFLGPSGVGKSTLLETLGLMNNTLLPGSDTTLHFPPDGPCSLETLLAGRGGSTLAVFRRRHLSFVFQQETLLRQFSALENVMITPMLRGISAQESLEIAQDCVQRMDLGIRVSSDTQVRHLSGGQRKRLEIARALASGAPIILGDEPLGSLDIGTSVKIMSQLKQEVDRRQLSLLLVSHSQELALGFADVIACIRQGEGMGSIGPGDLLCRQGTDWMTSAGDLVANPARWIAAPSTERKNDTPK